jgi:hypothetical protein
MIKNIKQFLKRIFTVLLPQKNKINSIGGSIARPIYRVINVIPANAEAPSNSQTFCIDIYIENKRIAERLERRKVDSDQAMA